MKNKDTALVLPDWHERFEMVDKIENHFHDIPLKISLGDAFDAWVTDPYRARQTAILQQRMLTDPSWVVLMGNHDAQYRWPQVSELECSGWKRDTAAAVREIISPGDWKNSALFATHGKWVLSHAGFGENIVGDPRKCRPAMLAMENLCIATLDSGYMHPMVGYNGVTWIRWDEGFKPIEGINQIVGHTELPEPGFRSGPHSHNWNLDCGLKYVAILTGDKIELVDTSKL